MSRPKTIFCDIDGTLIKHSGNLSNILNNYSNINENVLLPNTLNIINKWDKLGYNIILTTGRKESMRKYTEEQLSKLGIFYDQLIMGIGGGDRIIINDMKPNSNKNTCYAINVPRNKGITYSDFNNKFVTILDNQPPSVEKPWGREELITYNDKYVVKKLFMKCGECCSLQYHELKRETIYVLSGKLKLYIGTDINNLDEKILISGETIDIEPYIIHRMEGVEDSMYLECSTNELWDVVRLSDNYNRENTKETDYK